MDVMSPKIMSLATRIFEDEVSSNSHTVARGVLTYAACQKTFRGGNTQGPARSNRERAHISSGAPTIARIPGGSTRSIRRKDVC